MCRRDDEKIGLVLLMLVAAKDLGNISFLLFLPLVVVTLNGTGIEAFASSFEGSFWIDIELGCLWTSCRSRSRSRSPVTSVSEGF
jgi:hypothetical protein